MSTYEILFATTDMTGREGRMTDEERQERLRHHMYDTNEGIREQSERIVKLEELVADMWDAGHHVMPYGTAQRMKELGVEP